MEVLLLDIASKDDNKNKIVDEYLKNTLKSKVDEYFHGEES